MRSRTDKETSEETARRFPAVEIKALEFDRGARRVKLAMRIASSVPGAALPGTWSDGVWLYTDDTVHLTFPKGFVWEPPVQMVELLYPEAVNA